MAQRPSAYQIANVQQKTGLRNLENYELDCQRNCESAHVVDMQACVKSCIQQVTEQTRVAS